MSIAQQQKEEGTVETPSFPHGDFKMWCSKHSREIAAGAIVAGGILIGIFTLAASDVSMKELFEGKAISQEAPTPSSGGALGLQREPK